MTKQELELLELVTMHITEYGWSDDEFLIFLNYYEVEDFIQRLSDIFGNKKQEDAMNDKKQKRNNLSRRYR